MLKYLVLFTLLLIACNHTDETPDVSHIDASVEVTRFEQELFAIDTTSIEQEVERLSGEHTEFGDIFFYQIIGIPGSTQSLAENVGFFISDPMIKDLYDTCQVHFQDFSHYEQDLEQAFRYFKYYFPDKPLPRVYTCISGFEVGTFTIGDNLLGISLDFYLGPSYPYYDPNLFPEYIQSYMDKPYLVSKSIQALVANYLGETRGNTLLDYMIRNGIELYVKDKLLPFEPDEVIHEFSREQLSWLHNNEGQIWAYLMEQDLLFSMEYRKFQKLISPSPNVPNMPPEAPGRVGNWLGYRIVSDYMDVNPDITLQDLLDYPDPQQLLTDSRYKPARG